MKATWVVALLVLASVTGAAVQTDETDCPVEVSGNDEPGQALANVVGAQQSVVAREIEQRGFNATLENATTPDERATIVDTELERIDHRLATLEACQRALIDTREDGDLTAEEYRQRTETLEAEIADANDRLDNAAAAAENLSPEVREQADIESERFDGLGSRIETLQSFVDHPGRAIESVEGEAIESTIAEPTPNEPSMSEPTAEPTDEPTEVFGGQPTETVDQDTERPSSETPTPTPTIDPPTTDPTTTEQPTTKSADATEQDETTRPEPPSMSNPSEDDGDQGDSERTPESGRTGISDKKHYGRSH